MKQRQSALCLFAILIIATQSLFAVTITAINNNGNWNSSSTWNLNRKPANTDRVVIPENITVKITSKAYENDDLPVLSVKVYGTLKLIGPGTELNLNCGSSICILSDVGEIPNTGDESNIISIGNGENKVVWKGSDGHLANGECLEADCALPVTITEFNALKVSTGINIYWATAFENNFDHFELERSADGFNFETIAFINASGRLTHTYSFLDQTTNTGTVYYRLKNVDMDATFNWSEIISIELSDLVHFTVFPNPAASADLFVRANNAEGQILQVLIYDYTGKEYFSDTFVYEFPVRLDITKDITPGIYIIEVSNKDIRHIEKIRIE